MFVYRLKNKISPARGGTDHISHRLLKNYCDIQKIEFISTPYDLNSAIFLNKIGAKVFKVSSGDNDNIPLLSQIKKFKKPIILSTGMSDTNEFDHVIKSLNIKKIIKFPVV